MTQLVAIILTLIAFGMGLELSLQDFSRTFKAPKSLALGLLGQCILLPCIATALACCIPNPLIALGLLLIAVCPGGASSNYMTFLARGNVALSVSLTALNSCLAVVTVPLLFNGASSLALGYTVDVQLPVAKTMTSTFLYTVLPVLLGMLVRQRFRSFAARAASPIAGAAFLLLLALTPFLIARHVQALVPLIGAVLLWVSILLAIAMPTGYGLGRLGALPVADRRTLAVEIGVQNVALALFLALSFFKDNPQLVAVPVGYLFPMYVFVPGLVLLSRRGYA